MDLRQLEMLLAVVDCGGYTKAGKALHVSHSAIHRQIRLLEDELQVRILVRAGKRVRITETGTLLVDLSRRIRLEISSLRVQIDEAKQLQVGNLRIGTGTNILTFFLPAILERFRKQFPGIEVRVMTGSGTLSSVKWIVECWMSPLRIQQRRSFPRTSPEIRAAL